MTGLQLSGVDEQCVNRIHSLLGFCLSTCACCPQLSCCPCPSGGPPKLDPVTSVKQKIKDYGYMHMDKWELLLSITAKAMLAAEVRRWGIC